MLTDTTTSPACNAAPRRADGQAVRPFAFKPMPGHEEQLRPVPFAVDGEHETWACVYLTRGGQEVNLSASVPGASAQIALIPDQARVLAFQLLEAADQIDAEGAA